ncbi:caspase domain-containing protein [Armillaria fumosa]|nr:caspase domain-containing protein [Armillaria fumosa]
MVVDQPAEPSSPSSSIPESMQENGNKPELFSPPQSNTIGCPPPSLFALVIGIDKYLSNEISNLSGAVADIDAVNKFLQETLRVPKDQIKNLRNEEATRLTIEAAIKDLGNNPAIKKDDPILIFYAGHGAETNAPSGWASTNGKMQMLVPHDFLPGGSSDSKQGQGVLDVRFSHLLADLAAKKSDNITVILDCCHSGSGTRADDDDPTYAVRGIDLPAYYTIPDDLLHDIESDARASIISNGFKTTGLLSHVLLAACRHGQEAGERHGRGIFTSALLDLLQEKGVDELTYKDVITSLPDMHDQDPQCEGVHQSRYLFNSKVASPHRELYPIYASSDTPGQYLLEAGEAHGITKNAEFAIFSDQSIMSHLGTVVVVNTADFTSSCKFFSTRGDDTPFPLTSPGYALQTQVGEEQDIRLFVGKDERLLNTFQRISDEMRSDKGGKRGIRLVENREDAPDLAIIADGDDFHFEIMDKLCRRHGLERMPFKVKIDDSDTIYHVLQSSADFYWYLHHSSKGRLLAPNTLECMKLKETGAYTSDFEDIFMPDPDGHNLNNGDVIMINVDEEAIYGYKITNTASLPLYVSMFYFDVSDLSISLYYQPGSAKKNVDVCLPPGKSLAIGYGASGTVPHRYTLREGQDVDVGFLKLFFSTEYLDFSGLVQGSPFTGIRGAQQIAPGSRYLWDSMCVAVVQKRGLEGA